jgi:adenylate cyclase
MIRFLEDNKALAFIVFLLNSAPLFGALQGAFPWEQAVYFYWGEAVFFLVLLLGLHAKHLIVFLLLLLCAFLVFAVTKQNPIGDIGKTMTFWGFYALFWLGYIQTKQGLLGFTLRSLHPAKQFALYLSFMIIAVFVSYWLTLVVYYGWGYFPRMAFADYAYYLGIALVIPTLSLGLLKIIDMIGPRHFLLFLFGIYHRPVEQERVVLFLDMVESSAIAEKLKPETGMDFISRFIFDATAIFRIHGGDIVNYTGDGIVVLWPIKKADRVLKAIIALRRRLAQNSELYKKNFGIAPDFRIGIHAGKIVIGQIGEEKLFLGVYGDVVNVAARLEQINKKLGTKVLLSEKFSEYLSQGSKEFLTPMGKQEIPGRREKIHIFTLGTPKGAESHG